MCPHLYVVKSVGEYLEEGVQAAPGLLGVHLRHQLVEEALDAEGLHLRVDQQSAVRLHYAGAQGYHVLLLNLKQKRM